MLGRFRYMESERMGGLCFSYVSFLIYIVLCAFSCSGELLQNIGGEAKLAYLSRQIHFF
jgi:hypothetical protein